MPLHRRHPQARAHPSEERRMPLPPMPCRKTMLFVSGGSRPSPPEPHYWDTPPRVTRRRLSLLSWMDGTTYSRYVNRVSHSHILLGATRIRGHCRRVAATRLAPGNLQTSNGDRRLQEAVTFFLRDRSERWARETVPKLPSESSRLFLKSLSMGLQSAPSPKSGQ